MARAMMLVSAAVAAGVLLSGCGGADKGQPSATPSEASSSKATSSEATSSEATSSPTGSPTPASQGVDYTVADYLRDNGITQTTVLRGDEGAPVIDLPIPDGWKDVGPDTPEDAWGAIVLDDPAVADPPAIIARVARLTGEVDQATILELAPNAVLKQPGFDGPATGTADELSGFAAAEIAGTIKMDGVPTLVGRKTVVIPTPDAVYLLALDAQGPADQGAALAAATELIDSETVITP